LSSGKVIIWDFNGTLLDDMQVCIDCMNIMLKERELPLLNLDRYRDIFTFPVRDYYLTLGFDFQKEAYEIPAHGFIDLYRKNLHFAPLQKGVVETLEYFRSKGVRQIILSAMEQDFLEETLKLKGIDGYFEQIAGINNHLAEGKLDMARELINELDVDAQNIRMVGDTLHDYEVALGSGIQCVIITHGHQSFERLKKLDCLILSSLEELVNSFPLQS
jgi:phosphoglycolate phosphatase